MLDLGGISIAALTDAHGSFATMREAFGARFGDEAWTLPFRAFLLRSAEHTILVDAGIGPPPGNFVPERQAWLPQALADVEVSPDDIDTVFLTHLHVDHVGWCAVDGQPFFSGARYVVSRDDWNWAEGRDEARRVFDAKLAPLEPELVELREQELAPRVTIVPAPGHTPGHMCVRVTGDERAAYVLGDVAVHEAQLVEPDLEYVSEVDAKRAAATRRAVVGELANSDVVVAAAHLGDGLGQLATAANGFAWSGVDSGGRQPRRGS